MKNIGGWLLIAIVMVLFWWFVFKMFNDFSWEYYYQDRVEQTIIEKVKTEALRLRDEQDRAHLIEHYQKKIDQAKKNGNR